MPTLDELLKELELGNSLRISGQQRLDLEARLGVDTKELAMQWFGRCFNFRSFFVIIVQQLFVFYHHCDSFTC